MNSNSDEPDPLSTEARALNTRAFGALIGWNREWRGPIVELLRSDRPISPAIRDALANAIDGTSPFGIRLTLTGHERSARWWESIQDRREWRAFGPIVEPFINEAGNLLEGIEVASDRLDRSEAYCKKTYYYWRDCDSWIRSARTEGRHYAAMDDNLLSLEFHISSIEQKTLKPKPTSGAKFDKVFSEQWQALNSAADLIEVEGELRDGLISYLYWLERVQYQSA